MWNMTLLFTFWEKKKKRPTKVIYGDDAAFRDETDRSFYRDTYSNLPGWLLEGYGSSHLWSQLTDRYEYGLSLPTIVC